MEIRIEEDIKFIDEMVKEYNTYGDLDNPDYEDTDRIYKAIENILKKIKELEEENKLLLNGKVGVDLSYDDYIPRQKVEEKIEELKKHYNTDNNIRIYTLKNSYELQATILQELLEDK